MPFRDTVPPSKHLKSGSDRYLDCKPPGEALAARAVQEAGDDVVRQVGRAWQLALGRRPTAEDLAEALPVVREHGLAPLCRALFNSNEFLFLP